MDGYAAIPERNPSRKASVMMMGNGREWPDERFGNQTD